MPDTNSKAALGEDVLLGFDHVDLGYTEEPVLHDVELVLRRGERLVVAGPSGSGKSTLLKAAVGLLAPRAGRVWLLERWLEDLSEEELAGLRVRLGFLFQGGALLNSMTIAENVMLPLNQHTQLPEDVKEDLVFLKLNQVGLAQAAQKTPPELSGGMRKRASLARALVLDPELLLCDEPSAGLDPVTAAGLDELLLCLWHTLHMTLMVVTHELASIEQIAERLVMVNAGGLVFDGALAEARRSGLPALRDFFGRRAPPAGAGGRSLLERFQKPRKEVLP